MRSPRTTLLGVSVMIALGAFGCASKAEVGELRAQNAALRDSLEILWRSTEVVVRALAVLDTVPPPRCPPRCWTDIVKGFPSTQ